MQTSIQLMILVVPIQVQLGDNVYVHIHVHIHCLTSSSNLLMTASLLASTCDSISLIFFCVSSCIFCAKSSFEPAYFCCFS